MSPVPSSVWRMSDQAPRLLVTDLDNTLWDWFNAWYKSFSALLEGLVAQSNVDQAVLEQQIRVLHQRNHTTEYSNLVRELPALKEAAAPRDPREVFDAALHAQHSARLAHTQLYPGVMDGLHALKQAGIRIAAYTESGSYWTEWRIQRTGLDGVIDVLYSSPDPDLAAGVDLTELRTGHYAPEAYGLRITHHRHVPHGVTKPNVEILNSILADEKCAPAEAIYLGDSLMKDITMAQASGVLDVLASYGLVQHQPEYDLLRRVTHWTDEDVARERALARPQAKVTATHICHEGFHEILPLFGLERVGAR